MKHQRRRNVPGLRRGTQGDEPELTVGSIASWWCGVATVDDSFNLETIIRLLGQPDKGRLAFTTKQGKGLQLDMVKYADSLPASIGRAVIGSVKVTHSLHIATIEMNLALESMNLLLQQ